MGLIESSDVNCKVDIQWRKRGLFALRIIFDDEPKESCQIAIRDANLPCFQQHTIFRGDSTLAPFGIRKTIKINKMNLQPPTLYSYKYY